MKPEIKPCANCKEDLPRYTPNGRPYHSHLCQMCREDWQIVRKHKKKTPLVEKGS